MRDEDGEDDIKDKKNGTDGPRVIIGNDLIKDVTKDWKGASKFQEQY